MGIRAYGERVMEAMNGALMRIPQFKDALVEKYLSGGSGNKVEFEFDKRKFVVDRSAETLSQTQQDLLRVDVTDTASGGSVSSGVLIDRSKSDGEISNVDVLGTKSENNNQWQAVRDLSAVLTALRF